MALTTQQQSDMARQLEAIRQQALKIQSNIGTSTRQNQKVSGITQKEFEGLGRPLQESGDIYNVGGKRYKLIRGNTAAEDIYQDLGQSTTTDGATTGSTTDSKLSDIDYGAIYNSNLKEQMEAIRKAEEDQRQKQEAEYQKLQTAYLESQKPTTEETEAEKRLRELTYSRELGLAQAEEQPIATPFITGQQAAITRRAAIQAIPLETQLKAAQAKRQAAMDVAKTQYEFGAAKLGREAKLSETQRGRALELSKPTAYNAGQQVYQYDPETGKHKLQFAVPKTEEEKRSAIYQEYLDARKKGYAGTFSQYKTESQADKKTKLTGLTAEAKTEISRQALEALNLLETHPGKAGAVGAKIIPFTIPGTTRAGFLTQLDRVKALLTLPNLQYMKGLGAMSDREFATISASVAALDPKMPEAEFNMELSRIKQVLQTSIQRINSGQTVGETGSELTLEDIADQKGFDLENARQYYSDEEIRAILENR